MMDSPENFGEFGSIWDDEPKVVVDPSTTPSVRTPSLKELAAQIKDLKRENFQLKLRVHLTETKGVADPITATTPKRPPKDVVEVEKEYQTLKTEKEQLEIKLRQSQSQLVHEVALKKEALERESTLFNKYAELKTQLELFEREKCLSRLRDRGLKQSILNQVNFKTVAVNTDQVPLWNNKRNNSNCNAEEEYESSFLLFPPQNNSTNTGSVTWLQKYEEELKNAQTLEAALVQLRNELQVANSDRVLLLKQLKSSENIRKKEVRSMENRLRESLEQILAENKALIQANEEMKLALEKADEHAESVKKRAVLEMSNQLYYHQTALEKVHKEQSLLIEELQTLKKSCPFRLKQSAQTALQLCHGDEVVDEGLNEDLDSKVVWRKTNPTPLSNRHHHHNRESSSMAQMLTKPLDGDFDEQLVSSSNKDNGCKMNIIEDCYGPGCGQVEQRDLPSKFTNCQADHREDQEHRIFLGHEQSGGKNTNQMQETEPGKSRASSTVNEENIALVNRKLHEKNSRLALKLKKTRESLKNAISLLECSEKDKAGMEKIICRQLHRTHSILAEVKTTLIQSRTEPTCDNTKEKRPHNNDDSFQHHNINNNNSKETPVNYYNNVTIPTPATTVQ